MKFTYYFRVRVGKQTSTLIVKYEGYRGSVYTISNGKTIKFTHLDKNAVKIDEKHSSKRWPKYIDCTINENGFQIEYKGKISNIKVDTFAHLGFIDVISFEAYE